MSKTAKANSAEAAVKAAINVALPDLLPPTHVKLSEHAMLFWPAIIHARAREEWDSMDLVVAAQLADCQSMIEQESMLLREEGTIVPNGKGTQIENPRNRVVQTLATREMALMRALRMGGKPAGEVHHLGNTRATERKARETAAQLEGEDFLA